MNERTPAQDDALSLAGTLVDELAAADAYLFAVPLYNFGPSQHFKTYADLVIAGPRMVPGQTPVTAREPGLLVTVQGGNYSAGTPKEGWDHATAWMRRILEDVWQIDVNIVTREFTLVGANPHWTSSRTWPKRSRCMLNTMPGGTAAPSPRASTPRTPPLVARKRFDDLWPGCLAGPETVPIREDITPLDPTLPPDPAQRPLVPPSGVSRQRPARFPERSRSGH